MSHSPTPSPSSPTQRWLDACRSVFDRVAQQQTQIGQAADWFADSILAGRVVHLFGAGHSRIMVEEMWPRYGSFPGFNPLVELSMTFHHPVVGCNGQRQAMFIEHMPGLAERMLRNFVLSSLDSALIISSSGGSRVAIEMAELFRKQGIRVVALVSSQHAATSTSRMPGGKKLMDEADLVLDSGAPEGDAMVHIEGLEAPVAPGSTIGGCLLVNAIKAEVAQRLTNAGKPPYVLAASNVVGPEKATAMFEEAYDEHARRLVKLFDHPVKSSS